MKPGSIQMEEALELACELDRFASVYDPYDYADSVDNPIQNIVEIGGLIQSGKTEGIRNWLQMVAGDPDEEPEDIETAKVLLRKLKKEG